MGRVKELNERLEGLENWHEAHRKTFRVLEDRLDSLLHLMSDMVKMEAKIEKMEGGISEQLDRMEAAQVGSGKLVDRLIEMSMVNRGQPEQATCHRAQSRLENNFSNPQSWTEDDEVNEDVWPPPHCDIMDVNG